MTDKIRRVSYYEDIESLTRDQNSGLIQDFFLHLRTKFLTTNLFGL